MKTMPIQKVIMNSTMENTIPNPITIGFFSGKKLNKKYPLNGNKSHAAYPTMSQKFERYK
jgi:hypothetical protein